MGHPPQSRVKALAMPAPEFFRSPFEDRACFHEACAAKAVANTASVSVANSPSKKKRYLDPEKRREYMRDLMRKRRAKAV